MKTIILYYSYSGKTKALAVQKASELGAEIKKISEVKKPNMFCAFFFGCPKAMGRKKTKIKPVTIDFAEFEKIIIMAPVWAGHPAPTFNSIVDLLPEGKKVDIIMVSASSGTKDTKEKTIKLVTARGCEVTDYIDVTA